MTGDFTTVELARRLELALEASGIGIWQHNATTGEIHWDDRLRVLYDLPPESPPMWIELVHSDDRTRAEADFTEALRHRSGYSSRFRIILRDGGIRYIQSRAQYHQNDDGDELMIGAEWNVTADVLREEELRSRTVELENLRQEAEQAASRDYLTDLPNRRALKAFMDAPCDSPNAQRAVLHIDLDGFKSINDELGHEVGDEHLRKFASGIQSILPAHAFVARLGGDEFIVLIPLASTESALLLASSIIALAGSLAQRLNPVYGAASVGVSFGQGDWSHHIRISDAALYKSKRSGRGKYTIQVDYPASVDTHKVIFASEGSTNSSDGAQQNAGPRGR